VQLQLVLQGQIENLITLRMAVIEGFRFYTTAMVFSETAASASSRCLSRHRA